MSNLITRITIDVHHDRMTAEENKLFDMLVGAETLKLPNMGAQSILMEALQNGRADVKLEVKQGPVA